MKLTLEIKDRQFLVEMPGYDLSIPLVFDGDQPNTYGVEGATAQAWEGHGFVGDVRRGGSCNFEVYRLVPHCNGTHTECIGHLTHERATIRQALREALIPAALVTVDPEPGANCGDTYRPDFGPEDLVISSQALQKALAGIPDGFFEAIVVRTLPNGPEKCTRNWMEGLTPFFTLEAMAFLVGKGMRHLVTDLPSVDRLFDEGKLNAHHIFWGLPEGSQFLPDGPLSGKTITEMMFAPTEIPDGPYLLNLQVAPFMSDAAPSRPWLFPVKPR